MAPTAIPISVLVIPRREAAPGNEVGEAVAPVRVAFLIGSGTPVIKPLPVAVRADTTIVDALESTSSSKRSTLSQPPMIKVRVERRLFW
jgi:hypothetical protein